MGLNSRCSVSEENKRMKMTGYCVYGMGSSRLRCPYEAVTIHNEVCGLASDLGT